MRMRSMSNIRRGIPITKSRIEKIFPKLTPAQINRVAAHGHMRMIQRDEVIVEQGRYFRTIPCGNLRRD